MGDRIDLFDLARFRHLEVLNEWFCEVAVIGCMRPIDVVRLQGASHGIVTAQIHWGSHRDKRWSRGGT